LARAAATVPRRPLPFLVQIGLDWLAQDPAPSAAVLGGLLYGRVAPDRQQRRALTAPALVIGHSRDPLHPFSDADMLARELPDATLVHAHSVLELRLSPERLTRRIAEFVSTCWDAAGGPVTRRPNQRRERR
ncbi:MAG: alpha/beta fold hydrolase, partial [Solirubrobacteraceae bacterium]